MRIIPAIDIMDGKCVRLTKGDYNTQKVYNTNPLEVALEFEASGIKHLHLVDLDGARSRQIINHRVLYEITSKTSLKIDFGGVIKNHDDIRIAFENGAAQVTAGSVAVQNPVLFLEWLSEYGPEKIILGADFSKRKIATMGWTEISGTDVVDFIKNYESKGILYAICTDISRDGMLEGPSMDIYREITQNTGIKLIASGGITTIGDLQELRALGCEGAIIGKALYEGKIKLSELTELC